LVINKVFELDAQQNTIVILGWSGVFVDGERHFSIGNDILVWGTTLKDIFLKLELRERHFSMGNDVEGHLFEIGSSGTTF